jgi:hypothetical protein
LVEIKAAFFIVITNRTLQVAAADAGVDGVERGT